MGRGAAAPQRRAGGQQRKKSRDARLILVTVLRILKLLAQRYDPRRYEVLVARCLGAVLKPRLCQGLLDPAGDGPCATRHRVATTATERHETCRAAEPLRALPARPAPPGAMRVVVVDEELPYPANSGKRIRTLNLTLPLARRHQITYLAHPSAEAGETEQAAALLRSHGIEVVLADRRLPGKKGLAFLGRLLLNLLSPLPYSVQWHNSAALRRAIRRHAAAHAVDLWHCEWTPYAASVAAAGGPWLVMAHNVESLIWQRYAETERQPWKRWYIRQQWRKFQRFERRVFSQAAQVIAVSGADAALAREQFGAARVAIVENGVDLDYVRPESVERDRLSVLFLGSLDWRPNLDAVRLLLERIFPAILAREPRARLLLVGRKPPRWLRERVGESCGVTLHADPPDVRPFLRQCGVLAVPLRIGGGSRLKILEALAVECPVVSSAVGAEGLELVPGKHLVQVETAEDIGRALLECLRRPEPAREMARLGRQVVCARYNWSLLANRLESLWLEQLRAARQ